MISILFGLALFAVAIDTIRVFLDRYVFGKSTLAVVEDGGEHIVMSILVCYVFSAVTNFPYKSLGIEKKEAVYHRN